MTPFVLRRYPSQGVRGAASAAHTLLAESLADIRASALDGLAELRRVLGVLRTEDGAQTAPQPGLERLDEVIASARGGGLTVQTSVSGEATMLPAGVGLSAYRILQEAFAFGRV